MIDRFVELEEAVSKYVHRGQAIMVGGFGRGGTPFSMLEHMADHASKYGDLTLMKNDANEPDLGVGMLFARGMVKRLISTHIGLNKALISQMNAGEVEVELIPQGIFGERIRAGGAGIPAFLTDIGLGTPIAEGRETVELDGKPYLLERALRGNVALLKADLVDRAGNCWWRGSNRNFCSIMGTACDRVLVETERLVEVGAIEPENVHLPGLYVNAVVQASTPRHLRGGNKP